MTKEVGIIGVGLVGTALSERLLAAGYRVTGYDIVPAQLERLSRLGGVAAPSAAAVAAAAPRVIFSLPDSTVTCSVLAGIAPRLAPGAIVIDTTTGEPDQIAGFGARLAAQGTGYIDAMIGGSSRQVLAGEAIVICGGAADHLSACRDILAVCAARCFHVGHWGAGARMKLVLNLVLGLNRAVLAEGLSYASAGGIDPASALEILRAGPAYSRVMDIKGRKMLVGDFTAEARLSQHLKDVRLILETGARSGASLPLSCAHRQLLEKAEAAGFGDADNSAVIRAFDRKAQ
jgi:3-hydroxyisobutyrate dehydrogenase-like beta-hydroxyacid dehydrogenase